MSFARPWLLLLLALPVALALWEWQRRGHRVVVPFDHARLPRGGRLRRLLDALALAPAGLLAVAVLLLAGPTRLAPPGEERIVTNIQFVLDVSGSMLTGFGDGTRADAAVRAIADFTTFRKGDAFGLSVFGNEVIHWVPLTKDLSAIRLAAPFLKPDKMPPFMGGTQIGKALREVRTLLTARPEGDRMVVLISDGQSFDLGGGVAAQLGGELAADGITVFYIHIGDDQPSDETFALASASGGTAFLAGDPGALREVFQRVDKMKPAKMKPGAPEPVDFFAPFALAGLGLLALQLVALLGLRYAPW
jgi:Ca-activated chloride channel family protein